MKVKSLGVEKYIDTSQEDAVAVNVTLNSEYLDASESNLIVVKKGQMAMISGVFKFVKQIQSEEVVLVSGLPKADKTVNINIAFEDTSLGKALPCNLLIDTSGNLKEFYAYKPSAGSYIKFGASYIMDKTEFGGGFLTFFKKLRAFFLGKEVAYA